MAKKRIQNIISESRYALPITAIYGVLMGLLCGLVEQALWMQAGVLAVSTYLMMELNNANALLRIYSRMVSCSYIMLFLMSGLLSMPLMSSLIQLCFILFYAFFFHCYQDKGAVGRVFYAFLMLSLASLMCVEMLYLVPIMWIMLFTNVLAGNLRTFFASIIGILVPYWFVACYFVYTGELNVLIDHFVPLWTFGRLFDLTSLSLGNMVVLSLLAVLMLTGIIHFHRNSYKDKIRTRMLYEIFTVAGIYVMALIVAWPSLYDNLIGVLIVNIAPLIAHFFATTRTRITNIAFLVILVLIVVATVFNCLWTPLSIF